MKISIEKPDFSPLTIVIENRIEAINLANALSKSSAFVGTELHVALLEAIHGK
jgi:hypothetical protein